MTSVRIFIKNILSILLQLCCFDFHLATKLPESYSHCLCPTCLLIHSPRCCVTPKQRRMNSSHERLDYEIKSQVMSHISKSFLILSAQPALRI